MTSINSILPKKLDKIEEEIILDKIKTKMTSGVALYVSTIRYIEKKFGKEEVEKIRKFQLNRTINRWKEKRKDFKDHSLETFCKYIEESCTGTHEWKKTEDTKNKKCYKFKRCMWAEIFNELDASDIGYWICEGDGPAAKAFNPKIKFKRKKTLMKGDNCCNHEYYIEKQ